MRVAVLALVAAALAACSPSAPQGGADGSDAGGAGGGAASVFPNMLQAAYRAETTISHEGRSMPIVIVRDGAKARMELETGEGQTTIITNGDTGESFVIATMGGRQVAMRSTAMADEIQNPANAWSGEVANSATRTGVCSGAGESGGEWTRTDEGHTDTACLTNDGILLWAARDGVRTWETTLVQRGAQDPGLFTLPPGVQVMDLGQLGAGQHR